ncbi:MAG: hypothetical protein KatS3mg015_1555 [Fimbriimonadales bacterium]|nr:MAG: hypothetical protein KatS3mg015_1555 [Fimbriimonadales bacterium]
MNDLLFKGLSQSTEFGHYVPYLTNGITWVTVVVAFFLSDALGYLFARQKVQRAQDPVRTARNWWWVATLVSALIAGVVAWLVPFLGGTVEAGIAVAFLSFVVSFIVVALIWLFDPARAGS